MLKKFLKVKDISELLNRKPSSIYAMVSKREIPFHKKPGLGVYFLGPEIDEWLNEDGIDPRDYENER